MVNEINSWLNSDKNYDIGVGLYEKYGNSSCQKRLLRKSGPSRKNLDILEYELRKMIKGLNTPASIRQVEKPVEITLPKTVSIIPIQVKSDIISRRPNTSELEILNDRKITLLKIRDSLHATLELVDEHQRKKNALEILSVSDEIATIYERLAHFDKHGVLPAGETDKKKKELSQLDKTELYKLQNKLRTYVSKYKKLVTEDSKPGTKQKHKDLLALYTLELQDVNEKLNQ